VHATLRSLAGTSQLDGQDLVRELRQRDLLTLSEAHALIDGFTTAERLRGEDGATATGAADAEIIRLAHDSLADAIDRAESGSSSRAQPAADKGNVPPSASDSEPLAATQVPVGGGSKTNMLGRVLVGVVLLAALAALGYWALGTRDPAELRAGRAAYAAGDKARAANQFTVAAAKYPKLAEPYIFLGRIARENGNFRLASEALRRAVDLEPNNALAHRELASYLLVNDQPDLARAFYERAIRLDPNDRTALGFMGCTLMRLGNPAVAVRFLQRAGPGAWDSCAQNASPIPPVPQAPPGVQ
jgi:Flp pilus assembly protein TadD